MGLKYQKPCPLPVTSSGYTQTRDDILHGCRNITNVYRIKSDIETAKKGIYQDYLSPILGNLGDF